MENEFKNQNESFEKEAQGQASSQENQETQKEEVEAQKSENTQKQAEAENSGARNIMSDPDENGVRYIDANKLGVGMVTSSKKPKSGIKTFLLIMGIFAIVVVLMLAIRTETDSQNLVTIPNEPYVAVLNVEGTMQEGNVDYFGNPVGYQHGWTLDMIDQLMEDPNNTGIMLYVDSPGGAVYEIDELYLKLLEYKEYTGCPVYSSMGSMAASGGYYISAPCDKIIANRNTWTGSIGVTVGTFIDYSGLLERYGVRLTTIDSGKFKAMGSSYREMTEEEKAIWQSIVDEAYDQFVGVVAEGRGYEIEEVKEFADGRIYSAQQALELGLIDEIGDFDYALDLMLEENELWDCEIAYLTPPQNDNIFSKFLSGLAKSNESKSDLAILTELVDKQGKFPISYTCEALM